MRINWFVAALSIAAFVFGTAALGTHIQRSSDLRLVGTAQAIATTDIDCELVDLAKARLSQGKLLTNTQRRALEAITE